MSRSAPFHIHWRVYPHLDLSIMSGALSGIAALEQRNVITLSVEFMNAVVDHSYAVMELVVTQRSTGATRNVVFDLYDRADRIALTALRLSDVYFKRQFGPETLVAARQMPTKKIVPMGLTAGGYSRRTLRLVCIAIVASLRSSEVRRSRETLAHLLARAFGEVKFWATSTRPDGPLLRDSDVKRPGIVFQPRLWPSPPGSGDQFDIANVDRIAIVRALRQAFPNEDAVGLLPIHPAPELAPDVLLSERVSVTKYHQQLRTSLLAVNCAGLSDSVGWKFSEYLAAGNAIVSPPLEKEFLAPIVEGVHYLTYDSPAECVELCRRLLSDQTATRRMHELNRQYFLDWVNPPAHLTHLLRLAFD